jgi:hypothetical protein
MFKRFVVFAVLSFFESGTGCLGQICRTTHQTDLYCLIPAAFHTTSAPFAALYTPFGTELSQLPIARPAGLVLKLENGVLTPTNESLGPVFTGRAETLGRGRIFVGGTFQYFKFNSIDGNDLGNLPIVLSFPPASPNVYTVTNNRFDIKAQQYTVLVAYGITNKIDISMAMPFERVAMSVDVNGKEYAQNSSAVQPFDEYVPGSSSGISDVTFGLKANFIDTEKINFAGGLDVRLPSGDEMNFLGAGTWGIRPYAALSRHGRFSPHLNVGVQRNGESILNPTSDGRKQQLPTDFSYAIGADGAVTRRITVVGDLLGHYYFNAPRLTYPIPFTGINNSSLTTTPLSVQPVTSGYVTNDLSLGAKGVLHSHLVITGNLLIKLNNGGLRSTVAPLVGLSYTF